LWLLSPTYSLPFKIGYCPTCGGNFSLCQTQPISDSELEKQQTHQNNLEFLLTPANKFEEVENISKLIGQRLNYLRVRKKLAVSEVANRLGETWDKIGGIERGEAYRQGVSFQSYVQYAELLEVSFKELFEDAAKPKQRVPSKRRRVRRQVAIQEDELKEKVLRAIDELQDQGKIVTQRAISRLTSAAPSSLRYYPKVANIVAEIVTKNLSQQHNLSHTREAELAKQVKAVIIWLEQHEEKVTQLAISQKLGISIPTLKKNPQVRELINRLRLKKPIHSEEVI
jgi:transcriptional regulator with XRE-family HTH domain